MRIRLSDHFTYRRLIQFVLPSVAMMICTSLYSIIDGFFVSNFVGKTAFAAVNLVMPVTMAVGAVGFMIGTGGSAIVSRTLGEGKREQANRYFSMLVYISILASAVLSAIGIVFMPQICVFLKAEGQLLADSIVYGRMLFAFQAAFVLQNVFQIFFVTAEKPKLSLYISIAAGVTNAVLDFVLIKLCNLGIFGAALATGLGQIVGGVIPLIYFLSKNESLLRLVKTGFDGRILLKAMTNGSSEMVTNLSMSVVGLFYNFRLMAFAGEDGVAGYGVIMYVAFIFAAVFIGYSMGSAPLFGYHYGAENHDELYNLFRKSLILIGVVGVVMTVIAELTSRPLVGLFVGYDAALCEMTLRGYRIFSISFLIFGLNIWGSAFFTALGDGATSAVISFARTFLFQVASLIVLPIIWKLDGVWSSGVAAEIFALVVTVIFLITKRKKYRY